MTKAKIIDIAICEIHLKPLCCNSSHFFCHSYPLSAKREIPREEVIWEPVILSDALSGADSCLSGQGPAKPLAASAQGDFFEPLKGFYLRLYLHGELCQPFGRTGKGWDRDGLGSAPPLSPREPGRAAARPAAPAEAPAALRSPGPRWLWDTLKH